MSEKSKSLRGNWKDAGAGKANRLVRDISESLGKLPPQAQDLEQAILGGMLLERDKLHSVIDLLGVEDFYSEQHKEIYQAILDLYHKSDPIDMRTVVAKLRTNGKLQIVGGAYYIAELTSKVSSAANVEYHGRIVIEMKIKRDLIQIASQIHQDAYEDTSDAIQLLEDAQVKLDAIGGQYLKGNFESGAQIVDKLFIKILARRGQSGLTGTPTCIKNLDRVLGGWQDTDFVSIGARPGMGKTAFLLSSALHSAVDCGIPTAIFSLEMSSEQLMIRAISALAEIENTRIFKNYINDQEIDMMGHAGTKIKAAPLYIDDTPAISTIEFRARARRLVHEKKVKIIWVDYLQLMKGEQHGNRDQEIGSITSTCKRVAKELNVPVIALVQLSRAVEARGGDKRPLLSDMRESGNIEQDSDIVMFLYRAEYYGIETDEDNMPTQGVMELIVAKHRNGSLDTVPAKFIGKFTKVMDWDSRPTSMQQLPEGNFRKLEPPRTPFKDDTTTTTDDETPF